MDFSGRMENREPSSQLRAQGTSPVWKEFGKKSYKL